MPIIISGEIYTLSPCQARREKRYQLVFFPQTEKMFVTSDSAWCMLDQMKSHLTSLAEICLGLVQTYDVSLDVAEAETLIFINKLMSLGLLRSQKKEIKMRKKFSRPTFKPFEEVFDGECRMFAMPKRSCKMLPSGMPSHKGGDKDG